MKMMCIFGKVFVLLTIVEILAVQAKTSFRVLSFRNEIKNFVFSFAFRSLIRNFGFTEFTFVRKSKSKKILFSFAFRSLIRNFAGKYAL